MLKLNCSLWNSKKGQTFLNPTILSVHKTNTKRKETLDITFGCGLEVVDSVRVGCYHRPEATLHILLNMLLKAREKKQRTKSRVWEARVGRGSGRHKKEAATRKAAWRRSELVCYIVPEKITSHQYSTNQIIEATSLPFSTVSLTLHNLLWVDQVRVFLQPKWIFLPSCCVF